MKKRDDVSIVVFYHKKVFIDVIRDILSPYFSCVYFEPIAKKPSERFTLLVRNSKSLLSIFAFDRVEEATAVKQFLQSSPDYEQYFGIPTASLLLCDKQFRQKAFALCVDGVFDSYETIRPIYDNNKIALAMIRLADYLSLKIENEMLESQAQKVDESIKNISIEIGGLKTKYQSEGNKQASLIDTLITSFDGVMGDVPNSTLKREIHKLFNSLDAEKLSKLIETLIHNPMGRHLDELQKQSADFFFALDSDLSEHQSKLSKTRGNSLDGITVVVADDQEFMLKIISTMLEPKGIHVEKASNGVEAILKAKVILPDLVILDIDMPIMNGIKTLAAMKHVPQLINMPVIMLTSYSDMQNFQSCLDLGASDYIVKPTNAETMVKKITSVLSG